MALSATAVCHGAKKWRKVCTMVDSCSCILVYGRTLKYLKKLIENNIAWVIHRIDLSRGSHGTPVLHMG